MNKNRNLTTAVVIAAIVIIVTVSTSYYQKISSSQKNLPQNSVHRNEGMLMMNFSEYKNGVYSTNGNYISPGGVEEIGVTLTLKNGIIIDSNVEVKAVRDISVTMQTDFAQNYKSFVLGKDIDEINLTKVSGSSLTPNGFNDAVEKIKVQARS